MSGKRGHLYKMGMTSKCWRRKICDTVDKEIRFLFFLRIVDKLSLQ